MIELHQPSKQQIATWRDDNLLTLVALIPSWDRDAACKGQPRELFFPPAGAPPSDGIREQFCRNCPVKNPCLEAALADQTQAMDWGIWGDTTPNMRRRIRRTRAAGLPDPDFSVVTARSDAKASAKRALYRKRREAGLCADCAQAHHRACRHGECVCEKCSTRKELQSV